MEEAKYPQEPQLTLLERINNLETHHEETRKRMHDLEERLRHQRDRLDRVLGSEPEPLLVPDARDYNRSGR
jgi:hypothetical protein